MSIEGNSFSGRRPLPSAERCSDRRTLGIDWPNVRKALNEVSYTGWITAEVKSGDENYVKEVSARMDRILSGQNPV